MRLTERQRELLEAAAPFSHPGGVLMVTPITKGQYHCAYWRNFDQLEKRGLLELRTSGRYVITDSGRAAIGQAAPAWRSVAWYKDNVTVDEMLAHIAPKPSR